MRQNLWELTQTWILKINFQKFRYILNKKTRFLKIQLTILNFETHLLLDKVKRSIL